MLQATAGSGLERETIGKNSGNFRSPPLAQNSNVEFDESALKHITLSTLSSLARIAEEHPEALRYFPPGSCLLISAEGETGNAWENGYLRVYCELKYRAKSGTKSSGREMFYSIHGNTDVAQAFKDFLHRIMGKA